MKPESDFTLFCNYQGRATQEILDHVQDLLEDPELPLRTTVLNAPTGSGKTSVLLTVGCRLLRTRQFRSVLVLTPATDVRDSFQIGRVVVPGTDNCQPWEEDGTDACVPVSKHRTRWVEQIQGHLEDPRGEVEGGILVATHGAGVAFLKKGDLKRIDWTGVLLVIDEAHHVAVDYRHGDEAVDDGELSFEETRLGQLTLLAQREGASVLMATATPYRGNSQETVYPPEARLVSVSYAEYVEQRGAPKMLDMDLVGPNDEFGLRDMVVTTEKQLFGEGARFSGHSGIITEGDAKRLAALIVKEGTVDGQMCSKAIVRVPRVTGTGNVGRIAAALEEAVEGSWKSERPFKIVDGTGPNPSEFRKALKHEQRVKRFEESEMDILIVSGRGVEGTDWPLCSHYYHVGIAGSIKLVIQESGRGRRSKTHISDYPEAFRETSRFVMFAPNITEKLITKVRAKWHAGAVLVACFMHSQDIARTFIEHISLRIRTESRAQFKGGGSREWSRLMSRLNHMLPSEEDTGKAAQRIGRIEMTLRAETGETARIPDVVRCLGRDPDLSSKEKVAGVLLCIARVQEEGDPELEAALHAAVRNFVKRVLERPSSKEDVDETLFRAFQQVALKYDDMTSVRVEGQLEVMSRIHAKSIPEIARDMRKCIIPKPPYAQVERALVLWYRKHPMGRKLNGDLSSYFGYPPGSYVASQLRRHLKEGVPGQPDKVKNLNDALSSLMLL